MKLTKDVRCGRCVLLTEGKYKDKIAFVINPIDDKTILIDGPTTGVPRHPVHLNRVKMTKFSVPIFHTSSSKLVAEAVKKAEIVEKWEKTNLALKIRASKIRAGLNDFERFRLTQLKSKRSRMIKNALAKLQGAKPKGRVQEKTYIVTK